MKKLLFLGSALVMVLAMTSCKSSESAYKKAYEKAQAAQAGQMNAQVVTPQQQTQQTTPVQVTPVTPQQQTTPQTTQDYSNVSVRTEAVTLVSGNGLRAFSVVVGSAEQRPDPAAAVGSEGLCRTDCFGRRER